MRLRRAYWEARVPVGGLTLPVLRDGVDALERMIAASGVEGPPMIGLEATGALHRVGRSRSSGGGQGRCACSPRRRRPPRSWAREDSRDDRDCAALVWLVRQGAGRRVEDGGAVDAPSATVRHGGQLVGRSPGTRASVCTISSTRTGLSDEVCVVGVIDSGLCRRPGRRGARRA